MEWPLVLLSVSEGVASCVMLEDDAAGGAMDCVLLVSDILYGLQKGPGLQTTWFGERAWGGKE